MKTSELIDALASDPRPKRMGLAGRFYLSAGLGALASLCLFMAIAGPRANFVISLQSLRFDLKFIDTIALTLPAALVCLRLLRPDAQPGAFRLAFWRPCCCWARGSSAN